MQKGIKSYIWAKEDRDYLFESEPREFKIRMLEKLSEMDWNLQSYKGSQTSANDMVTD